MNSKNTQNQEPEADFWVGIEGGLTYNIAGKMEAFAWIVVLSKAFPALIGKSRTASFEIAAPIAALIHEGYELGHADDLVFGESNSKEKNGATGLLTENVMNRVLLYKAAVILALIPFKNSDLYSRDGSIDPKLQLKKNLEKPYLKIEVDKNLYLAIREPKHAEEQFALIDRNREHLRQWLPWVDYNKTVAESLAYIEMTLQSFKKGSELVFGIWFRGKFAGMIGLHDINRNQRKAVIGYWLGGEYTGKGIMTKACNAVIKHAFEELNLHRIEIQCAVGNTKSSAIPKRLGFQYEGTLKGGEWLYDRFLDLEVYGLINGN
ncbi:MAG: GNAT family N-acetyltransferase [Chitinophagales bacterium]